MPKHKIELVEGGDPIVIFYMGEEEIIVSGSVVEQGLEDFFTEFFHHAPEVVEPLEGALRRYHCPDS